MKTEPCQWLWPHLKAFFMLFLKHWCQLGWKSSAIRSYGTKTRTQCLDLFMTHFRVLRSLRVKRLCQSSFSSQLGYDRYKNAVSFFDNPWRNADSWPYPEISNTFIFVISFDNNMQRETPTHLYLKYTLVASSSKYVAKQSVILIVVVIFFSIQ